MQDDIRPSGQRGDDGILPDLISAPEDDNTTPETATAPIDQVIAEDKPISADDRISKKRGKQKLLLRRLSRKQYIIIGIIGLLIGSATASYFVFFKHDPPPPPPAAIEPPPPPPPEPTTAPSRLTGVEIPIELNELPVTGVMIENSPDARPQSGLHEAGIVFEAIAEGGITRFLALYLESKPKHIGPVRSVRPYYLDFLTPFDAPIAHAGGSAQALAQIRRGNIKDLEAFQNPAYYQRVNTRYAPHNLYTSRAKLLDLQKKKGFDKSKFKSFPRKEESPLDKPTAKDIDFRISGFLYDTHYDYDAKTNSYKRIMAGRPHKDEKSGKQISPKVLVAIVTSHRYSGIYSVYDVKGSGKIVVYQDGDAIKGKWKKKNRKSQFVFTKTDGTPLELNPGQTWITLIEPGGVSHKP